MREVKIQNFFGVFTILAVIMAHDNGSLLNAVTISITFPAFIIATFINK